MNPINKMNNNHSIKQEVFIIINSHILNELKKKKITPLEALLLGKIMFLCLANKHYECWASNKYLAKLFGISEVWVSKTLEKLEKFGYIQRIYPSENKRIIKFCFSPNSEGLKLEFKGGLNSSLRGLKLEFKQQYNIQYKEKNKKNIYKTEKQMKTPKSKVRSYFIKRGNTIIFVCPSCKRYCPVQNTVSVAPQVFLCLDCYQERKKFIEKLRSFKENFKEKTEILTPGEKTDMVVENSRIERKLKSKKG